MEQPHWWLTKDGDVAGFEMYRRHYSCRKSPKVAGVRQFVGPGQKVVLRTESGDAFWAWRKFKDDSGQQGVNCAMFRNESRIKSSVLIRQACAVAALCWPDTRCYTYVDPQKVKSRNPGYCFIVAGWRKCGVTKGGLLILEY